MDTTPTRIAPGIFQLVALKGAVKLEKMGMTRSRRPSAKTLAIQQLELPKSSTHDEVIAALEAKIKE